MIELRWVFGPRDDVERVLQYREWQPQCGLNDCKTCVKKFLSEWTSVPEVRESGPQVGRE